MDEIVTRIDPLDQEALKKSHTDLFIPTVEKYGGVRYFTNRDDHDIIETMRAGLAIPLISGINPWVSIDGKLYCDSLLTTTPQTHLEEAVRQGATRILMIDNNGVKNKKSDSKKIMPKDIVLYVYNMWNKYLGNAMIPEMIEAEERAKTYKVPSNVEVFTINPGELKISLTDNRPETIEFSNSFGREQTENNKELRKFLNTPNPIIIDNSD